MKVQDDQEKWPIIGQSDVAGVCRNICESIVDLERAFEAGELANRLTSSHFEHVLGPPLYKVYAKLAESAPGPLQHLRIDAVHALLALLQNDLIPIQIAHAKGRMPGESESRTTEPGTSTSPALRFEIADANFDGASSTPIRFDQMLNARFWRIGFTFETVDFCDAFAQALVRTAIRQLASDLSDLRKILEGINPTTLNRTLRIVPYPTEQRLEHLMLDILNEDGRHASMAPLHEDFLEKTDLRVKYAGLERKRGGRVQVTSIIDPILHKSKLERIKLAEEFVFLSPLSLAQFVDALQRASIVGAPSFALASLWECLEAKPADVPELASELKRTMFRALTRTPNSPLGPMVEVPQPIRQLIRLFVETHAIASTSKLRERERGSRVSSDSNG